MTLTIKATFENGVLKPKEPLALVEGTEVELLMTTPTDAPGRPKPGRPKRDPLADVIGIGQSGRTDGADQHDHYIYGTPKRQ